MRINFACGKKKWDGYFNIDAVSREGVEPDLVYEMEFDADGELLHSVPLDDGCADELVAAHVIEHFFQWEADAVIAEWKRLLEPGGKIVLELPNIALCAQNLLAGFPDQITMWGLYGDGSHRDPYMCHKFGYTPRTIASLLKRAGFTNIHVLAPQTHMRRTDRDMRVEAIKP